MSVSELVKKVHHTALCVRDFDAMRAFLVDFIGFQVDAERRERTETELSVVTGQENVRIRWAMLQLGAYRIELFHYFNPTGKTDPPAQCDTGFTHLAFAVSDVHEAYARSVAAGYDPISAPQTMRGGVSQVFYLRGPENVVVEFMQFANPEDI